MWLLELDRQDVGLSGVHGGGRRDHGRGGGHD